ncbi:hypothetical protein BLNAU_2325 [Blattamonas nauphoetae]|uniref:Uncharacterized protein n=1 Tax=Blattamonas nauphoetae TaxID=2049346 RepID=A0ABQ9YFE8_9EUKA|nr:hypothetical protein BLNAU_2325 [Blattamonas nauphoetae]
MENRRTDRTLLPFLNISFASLCIACSESLKFSHSHHSLNCTTLHSLNVPPNCVSLSKLSAHNPKNHHFHACQCVDDVGQCVIELSPSLCSFQASKRQVFGEGADCSGLNRAESISAYIFCDIVRPAFIITNDTPHLLHRSLSSFLTLLTSCSTQFTQFMSNESSLVVLAALAKFATQLHLAQPQSMFRTTLKGADDIAADDGQRGWNGRDHARMWRGEFAQLT